MVLTVPETEPSVAGDTARNALKSAKLSSGLETKVPMFVNFWSFVDKSIFHKDFLTVTGRTIIWDHISLYIMTIGGFS